MTATEPTRIEPAEILAALARGRTRRRRRIAAALVIAALPVGLVAWLVAGHLSAAIALQSRGFLVTWKADRTDWREGGSSSAEVSPGLLGVLPDDPRPADLALLARLHRLEHLNLSQLDGLRDEELGCLADLPDLTTLNLDQRFTLRWFARKPTRPTDAALPAIGRLRKLRDLNLAGTRISDGGLAHLTGLADLRVLDLGETDVTDAGLVHLAGLRNLSYVNLRKTRVSAEGAARLKASFPEADVDHESTPTPR